MTDKKPAVPKIDLQEHYQHSLIAHRITDVLRYGFLLILFLKYQAIDQRDQGALDYFLAAITLCLTGATVLSIGLEREVRRALGIRRKRFLHCLPSLGVLILWVIYQAEYNLRHAGSDAPALMIFSLFVMTFLLVTSYVMEIKLGLQPPYRPIFRPRPERLADATPRPQPTAPITPPVVTMPAIAPRKPLRKPPKPKPEKGPLDIIRTRPKPPGR